MNDNRAKLIFNSVTRGRSRRLVPVARGRLSEQYCTPIGHCDSDNRAIFIPIGYAGFIRCIMLMISGCET